METTKPINDFQSCLSPFHLLISRCVPSVSVILMVDFSSYLSVMIIYYLIFYECLEFWHKIISQHKYGFWHYSQHRLLDCYSLNISVIDYKHLEFRVRMYPSFLGRAKTEWIVTLTVTCGGGNSKVSLCNLSRRDVCLSELCLLQTNLQFWYGPTWPHFVSKSKQHDVRVQLDTPTSVWFLTC
jgi:hypothetical protein